MTRPQDDALDRSASRRFSRQLLRLGLAGDALANESVVSGLRSLHFVPLGLLADRVGSLGSGEIHLVDNPPHHRSLVLPHRHPLNYYPAESYSLYYHNGRAMARTDI